MNGGRGPARCGSTLSIRFANASPGDREIDVGREDCERDDCDRKAPKPPHESRAKLAPSWKPAAHQLLSFRPIPRVRAQPMRSRLSRFESSTSLSAMAGPRRSTRPRSGPTTASGRKAGPSRRRDIATDARVREAEMAAGVRCERADDAVQAGPRRRRRRPPARKSPPSRELSAGRIVRPRARIRRERRKPPRDAVGDRRHGRRRRRSPARRRRVRSPPSGRARTPSRPSGLQGRSSVAGGSE